MTPTTQAARRPGPVHAGPAAAPHARVPSDPSSYRRCTARLRHDRCTARAIDGGDRCRLHTLRRPA